MLLTSKYHAHAHALKEAQHTGALLKAPSRTLGLTAELSAEILETLHKLNVADGLTVTGRRIIASDAIQSDGDAEPGRLGYLYRERVRHDEDEDEESSVAINVGRHKSLRLEPKFVLHLSGALENASSLDEFRAAIIGISHAWEVLAVPYADEEWNYDDQVCANGFSRELIIGTSKTLTYKSRQNFSELMAHANFSFSKVKGRESQIAGFSTGAKASMSTIDEAFHLYQNLPSAEKAAGNASGGVLALNTLCKPIRITAGEEWSFVSTGFGLKALRVSVVR